MDNSYIAPASSHQAAGLEKVIFSSQKLMFLEKVIEFIVKTDVF